MNVKTAEKAAQGAGTPKKENKISSKNLSSSVKPNDKSKGKENEGKQVVQINQKAKEFADLKAHFEKLDKNVRTRSVLLNHETKVERCLSSFEKTDEFSVEDMEETDNVKSITIKVESDGHRAGYEIDNPGLCKRVLEFIKGELKNAITLVETELLEST